MRSFKDKVAVITGAGSGIGRALAQDLATRGARLALSDVDGTGLAGTLELCRGAEARTYRLDVSKREQVFAHADEVKHDFGTAHCLINNAGVTLSATVEHCTIEEFEWLLGINLWGVIYGTKAFLPMMLAQREGHIVNISSVFGLVSAPTQGAYNVTKFGVRGLTECLWRELEGTGVGATCVHPGGVRTNIAKAAPTGKLAGEYEREKLGVVDTLLVTPPEDCARDILDGVERGRKRIVTGNKSGLVELVSRLLPTSHGWVMQRFGM
uniref:Serine/threonine protein kinase n=1 Tax=bacterium enrichment culture TaxID=207831 RepID=A0A0R7N6J3_9BACT|nr:serine/threonine protein kinase [bacterium enrichment culture]